MRVLNYPRRHYVLTAEKRTIKGRSYDLYEKNYEGKGRWQIFKKALANFIRTCGFGLRKETNRERWIAVFKGRKVIAVPTSPQTGSATLSSQTLFPSSRSNESSKSGSSKITPVNQSSAVSLNSTLNEATIYYLNNGCEFFLPFLSNIIPGCIALNSMDLLTEEDSFIYAVEINARTDHGVHDALNQIRKKVNKVIVLALVNSSSWNKSDLPHIQSRLTEMGILQESDFFICHSFTRNFISNGIDRTTPPPTLHNPDELRADLKNAIRH